MTFVIKNWNKHFETSETRKLKSLLWVKIPNRQDTLAYRTISKMKDGAEIFAAWILMIQVASKQPERGTVPYSAEELEIITGFPANIFKKALSVLQTPKIDWISQSPEALGEYPEVSVKNPDTPPIDRMEGNGIEKKEKSKRGFTKPTLQEVLDYCLERKNKINAQKFYDHYEARGWCLTHGKQMVDWQACVRTWEQNGMVVATPLAIVAPDRPQVAKTVPFWKLEERQILGRCSPEEADAYGQAIFWIDGESRDKELDAIYENMKLREWADKGTKEAYEKNYPIFIRHKKEDTQLVDDGPMPF